MRNEEEQFTLEFVAPEFAIATNELAKDAKEAGTYQGMLERENRVLRLLQEQISEGRI